MKRKEKHEEKKKFANGDKAIMGVVIGAIMLVMGALILFVIGGVVAPGLYSESNATMPIDASTRVTETFNTSAYDSWVQLGNTNIFNGTEAISNATYTAVDADYDMNDTDGKIKTLSTGSMLNYTEYNASYKIFYKTEPYLMREKATSSLVSMIGIGGMVLMIGGFGLIIASLWGSFGGVLFVLLAVS